MILELGSGPSLGSIHLIEELSKVSNTTTGKPIIYLTDLPEVLTLTRRSLDKHVPSIEEMVDVRVRPLAWDDKDAAKKIGDELSREGRGLTHILMIDLVSPSFPSRISRVNACISDGWIAGLLPTSVPSSSSYSP